MAITSAKEITSATISWALTSAKAIRSAYMYGNNTNHTQIIEIIKINIFPYAFFVFKIAGITFSSDLRKPCWITGLSHKSRKCPVIEKNHINIPLEFIYFDMFLLGTILPLFIYFVVVNVTSDAPVMC